MIKTIPLNKLIASPRNVRRRFNEQADLELKAAIEARGLLQNLVVTKATKPRGSFAVEAGERRRRALVALSEDGKLAKDFGVCCLVLEKVADAREASLAENFQRLRMNPADECLAFQQLVEQGTDAEGIARRFGLGTRFVEGRLRLADLAPIVFEALGAGDISLDVAKAYAATPDRERQAYVFEQMSTGYGAPHPDSIRRMMTQATASAIDRRALLVGEETYVAAGGRIERDLFDDEVSTRWLDVDLLERLATEKMEALAAKTAAETGFAFVKPTLGSWVPYAETEGLLRVPVERPPLSDEESARIGALEAEIEELAGTMEDGAGGEAQWHAAEARVRSLSDEIDRITDKPPVIDEEQKAQLGVFLVLDDEGRPQLDPSFYSEAVEDGASADAGVSASEDEPEGRTKPAGLSRRLVDELAMQRRDILAVHVAADPGLALDLAIFLMIDREAGHWGEKSGSSLSAVAPPDPVTSFNTPEAAATAAREQAVEALDRSWTAGETRAERFDALREFSDEQRAAWLGHAIARTLEASLNCPGDRACAFHDHLGRLLGIDVASWWRPTGANYFDRVPKALALAALGEVGGPELAARYAKAKKVELAQTCERLFAGDFIAEAEVKAAALAWVPEAMRFAPPPGAEPAQPSADDGEGTPPWEEGEESDGEPSTEGLHAVEEAA